MNVDQIEKAIQTAEEGLTLLRAWREALQARQQAAVAAVPVTDQAAPPAAQSQPPIEAEPAAASVQDAAMARLRGDDDGHA